MKIKKEYIILAVLIVALSLYLLLHKRDRTQYELPVLQGLPAAHINKIEIAKPGDSVIVLERKDDRWLISPGSYPADSGKVSVLLETIENLSLSALVSESKSYERYGLSGSDKIGVKAWTDNELKRDFEVGKEASSFQHTFVKIAGDDRVFQARENFRGRFDQTLDSLRDKTVLKFEPLEVESIEVRDAQKTVTFVRKSVPVEVSAGQKSKAPSTGGEVVWESSEGSADEAKLTQLLTSLSALKCKGYIYDRKKNDFKNPVYSLKLKGSEVYSLSLFSEDDKNKSDYLGVSSQNDSPFLLPKNQAARIMPPPGDIIKKPDKSQNP
jgi:Domain of unknown function (DUF4340)